MREGNFVYDLVQSLDAKELEAVRKLAHGRKKVPARTLDLLAELRKQKPYNRSRLKARFSALDTLSFRLKTLILDALRIRSGDDSTEEIIYRHLKTERILYEKGLYNAAEKELDEARRLATECQLTGHLLLVLRRGQHRLIERKTKALAQEVEENVQIILNTLAQYEEEVRAIVEYQLYFSRQRVRESGAAEPHEPPREIEVVPTFDAQFYSLMTRSLQARAVNDLPAAMQATKAAIDLFDQPEHQEIKSARLSKYQILLSNYAVYMCALGNYAQVREWMATLAASPAVSFNDEAERFQSTMHLELLIMLNTQDFSRHEILLEKIEAGLEKYGEKINRARRLTIWFNLFLVELITENYAGARKWVDKIIRNKKFEVRQEIQYTTRLFELIIFYELDIWDPPDSALTAVTRYMQRKSQLTPFKEKIIQSMRELSRTPESERKRVFASLQADLLAILADEEKMDRLGLKVMIAWATSKVEGRHVWECFSLSGQ